MKGKVKKLIKERGFGFIKVDDGKDLFFHRSDMRSEDQFETIELEQDVEFEIEKTRKGSKAVDVAFVN